MDYSYNSVCYLRKYKSHPRISGVTKWRTKWCRRWRQWWLCLVEGYLEFESENSDLPRLQMLGTRESKALLDSSIWRHEKYTEYICLLSGTIRSDRMQRETFIFVTPHCIYSAMVLPLVRTRIRSLKSDNVNWVIAGILVSRTESARGWNMLWGRSYGFDNPVRIRRV